MQTTLLFRWIILTVWSSAVGFSWHGEVCSWRLHGLIVFLFFFCAWLLTCSFGLLSFFLRLAFLYFLLLFFLLLLLLGVGLGQEYSVPSLRQLCLDVLSPH